MVALIDVIARCSKTVNIEKVLGALSCYLKRRECS